MRTAVLCAMWVLVCKLIGVQSGFSDLGKWINPRIAKADDSHKLPAEKVDAYLKHIQLRKKIKSIEVPLLIFHAKDDHVVPFSQSEKIHQWAPKSTFVAFDIGRHNVFSYNQEKYSKAMSRFIKKLK